MATQVKASQISYGNSGSWYKRLYALQSKFGATLNANTTISSGSQITASNMNTFINRLNALQSNPYGSYANWTSYKPATVTAGTKITASTTYNKINNMLTSLESLNANCTNHDETDYGNWSNCGDYNDCSDYTYNNPACDECGANSYDGDGCDDEYGSGHYNFSGDCAYLSNCPGDCEDWSDCGVESNYSNDSENSGNGSGCTDKSNYGVEK